MENQDNNKIDWNDDSGAIHTSSQKYKTSPKDGFQKNHAYYQTNSYGKKNRYIKGIQTGIIITIIVVLIIIGLIFAVATRISKENIEQQEVNKNELDIKTNKETIYELFNNFPKSNNIYYTSKNLYNEKSIGPTIYQIDILAELTDESYDNFISQIEFDESKNFEIKINPHNINYTWKSIKNTQVIETKNIEVASIRNIYLDENSKTIYVIAIGGN